AAAIRTLVTRAHVVAEGAGGASVAAALGSGVATGAGGGETRLPDGPIVCVVSGGNIDSAKLAAILEGRVPWVWVRRPSAAPREAGGSPPYGLGPRARNASTRGFTRSGRSIIALCDAPGTIQRSACGIERAIISVCSGRIRSCSPAHTRTSARM